MTSDIRTALRRLNDAAHEALAAAIKTPDSGDLVADLYDISFQTDILADLHDIAFQTDVLVDETAPNVETSNG